VSVRRTCFADAQRGKMGRHSLENVWLSTIAKQRARESCNWNPYPQLSILGRDASTPNELASRLRSPLSMTQRIPMPSRDHLHTKRLRSGVQLKRSPVESFGVLMGSKEGEFGVPQRGVWG